MSTNPVDAVPKIPRVAPGTLQGPMQLPVSYCTKSYDLSKYTTPCGTHKGRGKQK